MKSFELDKRYTVECEWRKTRIAFKHVARVLCNGRSVLETKICYQNRTWETYTYQSVLHQAINKHFNEEEAKRYIAIVDGVKHEDPTLKGAALLGSLGELFGTTPAERNALKKRALDTVPGIDFPDDFDGLSEEEKTRRLDGALGVIKQ